jgi:hypothetical protein
VPYTIPLKQPFQRLRIIEQRAPPFDDRVTEGGQQRELRLGWRNRMRRIELEG